MGKLAGEIFHLKSSNVLKKCSAGFLRKEGEPKDKFYLKKVLRTNPNN